MKQTQIHAIKKDTPRPPVPVDVRTPSGKKALPW